MGDAALRALPEAESLPERIASKGDGEMDPRMDDAALLAAIPVPAKNTMLRQEQFGAMLAGGNLSILNFNHDAVAIWQLMDGARTVRDIEDALLKTYSKDGVRENLLEFMRYCINNECITLIEH